MLNYMIYVHLNTSDNCYGITVHLYFEAEKVISDVMYSQVSEEPDIFLCLPGIAHLFIWLFMSLSLFLYKSIIICNIYLGIRINEWRIEFSSRMCVNIVLLVSITIQGQTYDSNYNLMYMVIQSFFCCDDIYAGTLVPYNNKYFGQCCYVAWYHWAGPACIIRPSDHAP